MLGFNVPKKAPVVPQAEPNTPDSETYVDPVIAWRATGLIDRGFALEDVLRFVSIPDVLHTVDALREKGCDNAFIVDFLTD